MKNHQMRLGFYITLSENLITGGEYPHPEDFIYDHLGSYDDDYLYIENDNKWLFGEPIEKIEGLIDFDFNSFLALDTLDMNKIMETFKSDKNIAHVLKVMDQVWGNENYTVNLGLYWVKDEY